MHIQAAGVEGERECVWNAKRSPIPCVRVSQRRFAIKVDTMRKRVKNDVKECCVNDGNGIESIWP